MKEKVSITLDEDVLVRADALVDGVNIRNRSQAVEFLVRKALAEKGVTTAVILAGGPRPRQGRLAKPLVPIAGRPLILHMLEKLRAAGVRTVIIAAGAAAAEVRAVVGDGGPFGVQVTYVPDKDAGTAGAVRAAAKKVAGPFFVVFGDEYFDFDLGRMVDFHAANGMDATIAVAATALGESKDAISIAGNRITAFQAHVQKPTHHVSAGVFLLEPRLLPRLPKAGSLEEDLFPALARRGKLGAFVFSGTWRHLR